MTAVYKRELRSYLTSMVGYLFIFFILLLTGIYFSAYQLAAAYPKFEYTLSALTFVFLISVPILTMRVFAEERKQKTDQLLLTAPVSVGQIVLGMAEMSSAIPRTEIGFTSHGCCCRRTGQIL